MSATLKQTQQLIYVIMAEIGSPMTNNELADVLDVPKPVISQAINNAVQAKNPLISISKNPNEGYVFIGKVSDIPTDIDLGEIDSANDENVLIDDEHKPEKDKDHLSSEEENIKITPEIENKEKNIVISEKKDSDKKSIETSIDPILFNMSKVASLFESKRIIAESIALKKSGLNKNLFVSAVSELEKRNAIIIKEMDDYDEKVYKKTPETLDFIIDFTPETKESVETKKNINIQKPSKSKKENILPEVSQEKSQEITNEDKYIDRSIINYIKKNTPKAKSGISKAISNNYKKNKNNEFGKINIPTINERIEYLVSTGKICEFKVGSSFKYKLPEKDSLINNEVKSNTEEKHNISVEKEIVIDEIKSLKQADEEADQNEEKSSTLSETEINVSHSQSDSDLSESKHIESKEIKSVSSEALLDKEKEMVKILIKQVEDLKLELKETKDSLNAANNKLTSARQLLA